MNKRQGLTIRPGMDVYSVDQSEYIGSVVKVWQAGSTASSGGDTAGPTGAVPRATPNLVHEQGATQSPTEHTGNRMLGEEMGPFPTVLVGNAGPATQSAENDYATAATHGEPDVIAFAVRPGRINLGPLTPSFYVPISAVHGISMERLVVGVQKDRIPAAWRRRPSRDR